MCITEDKLVESYGKATPRERFRLIYKIYSIFPQLVDCYETGLFNRILFEVEYNRRKKNDDDLGVRIQTSHRSDPTAAKAIEHIMIRDAIEECNFSGNILKETDDPEKHKRDILTIHMMRREYEVFETSLRALPLAEYRITYSHLHDGRKLVEIAEEEDKAYQTILNIVSKTRKKLEGKTIAFFRETIQEDEIMGYKRKEYENMESLFTNGKKKFVKYEEGAAMYSMGIHAFTELAKEAKAIYRIRRIVLVNTEIIDEYIENFRDI